jgi:ribosomal protein S12 methylthiotransferase accessory factor
LVGVKPNDIIPELTSTGYASHVVVPNAILASLCEVFERDALAIAWHNRLPFIPLDPAGSAIEALVATAPACSRIRWSFFRIPTDLPFPIVMALAECAESSPHAVVGVACRPDIEAAAEKALFEVCQAYPYLRAAPVRRPVRIRQLSDHQNLFATKHGADLLRRNLVIWDKPAVIIESDCATQRASCADAVATAVYALERLDLEVIIAEITTADALACGYRVVRTLVPGAVDIAADARFAQFGAKRLYNAPVAMGLADAPLSESELNHLPVPIS